MTIEGNRYRCIIPFTSESEYIKSVSYVKFNKAFISEIVELGPISFTCDLEQKDEFMHAIYGSKVILTEIMHLREFDDIEEPKFVINKCVKVVMSNNNVYYTI